MPATPYRRVIFSLTTAEGWNGRFGPFFLKCIFYTYDGAKIKISPSFGRFYPPKESLLPSPGRFAKIVVEPTALRYEILLNSL